MERHKREGACYPRYLVSAVLARIAV